ncbi:MAG TPA: phosphoglycerate kinase [Mycobacteriales bacterium]|nr:phosphoglycerate kinase [Mycobacteriales bacterium]
MGSLPGVGSLGDVAGKRVLVRSDLNVPLADAANGDRVITDDGRIRASVPQIRALLDAGAKVVVCAHLGRPKGAADPAYSLAPVAARLAELLGRDVTFVPQLESVAGDLWGGNDVALLENVRFDPGETSKEAGARAAFADRLAALADCYVDDAFGAVHRKHASVYDVAQRLPHAAGGLVQREVEVLQRLTTDPQRPYVVVLGGSKVSDKLAVIASLLPKVDRLLVGGGMCFTFLSAGGHDVGDSLLEADQIGACRDFIATGKVVLPVDIVVADEVSADASTQTIDADRIPAGTKGLDIGPRTVQLFTDELAGARTVFWNGPMGVFELAPFAAGTRGVAEAIARLGSGEPDVLTVVGGGDSAAAVRALGVDEARFGHISTGGGASLEYLEGKQLPGLTVLES